MDKQNQLTQDSTTKIANMFQGWIDDDLLEDRLEYSEQDLRDAYPDLTEEEVVGLNDLVEFEKTNRYLFDNFDPMAFKLCITEALDGDLEGWTKTEQVTIKRFLNDMIIAVMHS